MRSRPERECLELISKILPHEYHEATEVDEAEEVGGVILMARQDAAKLLQPGKQSLDFPAPLVATQRTAVLSDGFNPVGAMRSD